MQKTKYYILVGLQFLGIFLIFSSGSIILSSTILFLVEITGILLGLWAIYSMRIGNFNITPEIKQSGEMVTRGPYKFVRHPMYLAIIVTLSPIVIDHFTYARLVVLILLFAVLIYKINIEEELLLKHFEKYKEYSEHSWRIIPFLY